jgi:outer membrane protein
MVSGCLRRKKTPNLVASAKLQEKAHLADAEASREDIVLATD